MVPPHRHHLPVVQYDMVAGQVLIRVVHRALEHCETLRGVLNSGYRRGGTATLCVKVGGNWDIGDFPVFCVKALTGIGRLPDTVQDRSIPIEMRRKTRDAQVTRFKRRDAKAEPTPLKGPLEQ